MATIPETGFVRGSLIYNTTKGPNAGPGLVPVSRSTWLAGVKSGRFPRPVKLGPRCVAWRAEDIRQLIEQLGKRGGAAE